MHTFTLITYLFTCSQCLHILDQADVHLVVIMWHEWHLEWSRPNKRYLENKGILPVVHTREQKLAWAHITQLALLGYESMWWPEESAYYNVQICLRLWTLRMLMLLRLDWHFKQGKYDRYNISRHLIFNIKLEKVRIIERIWQVKNSLPEREQSPVKN